MPEFPIFPGDELISNEDLVAHRATSAYLQLRHIDYNNTHPFPYGNFRALYSSLHQVLYHHYPPNEYARIALPTDLHIENRRLGWREYCLKPEGYRTEKIFRLPADAAFTASYHTGAVTMFDFASPAATYNLRVYAPGLVPTENDKCSIDYCLGGKALSYSFPQQVYMSGYLPGRRNYSHLTCICGYEVHWACLYTKFMMTLHYHNNECRGAKFDAPLATAAMRSAYCCGECGAEFVEAKRNRIRCVLQAYYCCLGIVPEFDYHHSFGYEAALDQTHAIAGAAPDCLTIGGNSYGWTHIKWVGRYVEPRMLIDLIGYENLHILARRLDQLMHMDPTPNSIFRELIAVLGERGNLNVLSYPIEGYHDDLDTRIRATVTSAELRQGIEHRLQRTIKRRRYNNRGRVLR